MTDKLPPSHEERICILEKTVEEMKERLDRLWMGSMPSFMDHLKDALDKGKEKE